MKLKDCPICGAKAFIHRMEPDGYFMGYSVGCPKYKVGDGIHMVRMAYHNFNSKQEAAKFWNVDL